MKAPIFNNLVVTGFLLSESKVQKEGDSNSHKHKYAVNECPDKRGVKVERDKPGYAYEQINSEQ